MYLTAGSGGNELWYNDLHTLNLDTLEWAEVKVEGLLPTPRDYTTLTNLNNWVSKNCTLMVDLSIDVSLLCTQYLVMFAGFSGSDQSPLSDLHVLDLTASESVCVCVWVWVGGGGVGLGRVFSDVSTLQSLSPGVWLPWKQTCTPCLGMPTPLSSSMTRSENHQYWPLPPHSLTFLSLLPLLLPDLPLPLPLFLSSSPLLPLPTTLPPS